jgi:hypothetical protein
MRLACLDGTLEYHEHLAPLGAFAEDPGSRRKPSNLTGKEKFLDLPDAHAGEQG